MSKLVLVRSDDVIYFDVVGLFLALYDDLVYMSEVNRGYVIDIGDAGNDLICASLSEIEFWLYVGRSSVYNSSDDVNGVLPYILVLVIPW